MADVDFISLPYAEVARSEEGSVKIKFQGAYMASPTLESLSNDLAAAAETVGPSVVAVHAQHRIPSSGVLWRKDVIVTVNHGIRRNEGISVLLGPDESVAATVAGRDSSTDLAILKLSPNGTLPVPQLADASSLKLANLVLALGRSWRGNLVASSGIVGGLSGEWRSWRGGKIDRQIRLDLELYPGFSGGPLVNAQGQVAGINTSGLARGRAVTIPASTVNRVVDELLEKGHIARPYLGLALQPVAVPEALRSKLKSQLTTGLVVIHVEPGGPADRAGMLLGDVLVELQGRSLEGMDSVQQILSSAKLSEKVPAIVLRGGSPLQLNVTLEDRPTQ
jgi:serine protease DegQ